MESTQPHRGAAPADGSAGSLNRGFVSQDPERQREQPSEPADATPASDPAYSFDVRKAAGRRPASGGAKREESAPAPAPGKKKRDRR